MRKIKILSYKRKREQKTDYKKRLKLLISKKNRLVVRKFNKNIVAQIIEYDQNGDKVVAAAHTRELIKLGWKGARGNIPAAYLTGLLCGKKAAKAGVKEAVLDTGLQSSVKGSAIYAALKGVVDSGINVPHSKEILPPEERIYGQHIAEYSKILSKDKARLEKQFGDYIKKGVSLENFKKNVEEVKAKILKL